jgi:hypothetical protein
MTHIQENEIPQLEKLIRRHSFRNPYWSAPQSLLANQGLLNAAGVINAADELIRYWWRVMLIFAIPYWAVTGASFFRDLAVADRDEYGNLLNSQFRSAFTNWLLVVALAIFAFLSLSRLWLGFSRMIAKSRIKARSIEEYQVWLSDVAATDPSRYSDILRWEQNEKMIAFQGRLLAEQMHQSQELSKIRSGLKRSHKMP